MIADTARRAARPRLILTARSRLILTARPRLILTARPRLILVVAILAVGCQRAQPQTSGLPTPGPVPGVPGTVLYAVPAGFRTLEPATQNSFLLPLQTAGVYPALPAVSPTGALVAYSGYRTGKSALDLGGTSLYLMTAEGTEHRLLKAHDAPGVALLDPAWTPDGRAVFFSRYGRDGSIRLERIRADGSGRTVVALQARTPSLSPDGRRLAYIGIAPKSFAPSIRVARPDGSQEKILAAQPPFEDFASPRFMSNEQLIFAAVGGPAPSSPAPGQPQPGRSEWRGLRIARGPRVVYAHGVPWDLWRVSADGSDLRRLTNLGQDLPTMGIAPNGAWIAYTAEGGLYLTDAEGRRLYTLATGAGSGVAWLP